MPNEFDDCFDQMHECAEETIGAAQQVTIDGTPYDCIASEISKDDMLVHGGSGENGGFRVLVRASDFGTAPEKLDSIVYDGTTLDVISFTKANDATYEIIAGDFTLNP